jgi:hypothetical protein
LNKTKSDDTPVTFSYIAESNSVSDSLWCLRVLSKKYLKERCYLMAEMAESVAYLYNKDDRVDECIKAIKEYGAGVITIEELNKKKDAVYASYVAVKAYPSTASASVVYAVYASYASASYASVVDADAFVESYPSTAAVYALSATSADVEVEREKQKALIKKYLG